MRKTIIEFSFCDTEVYLHQKCSSLPKETAPPKQEDQFSDDNLQTSITLTTTNNNNIKLFQGMSNAVLLSSVNYATSQ